MEVLSRHKPPCPYWSGSGLYLGHHVLEYTRSPIIQCDDWTSVLQRFICQRHQPTQAALEDHQSGENPGQCLGMGKRSVSRVLWAGPKLMRAPRILRSRECHKQVRYTGHPRGWDRGKPRSWFQPTPSHTLMYRTVRTTHWQATTRASMTVFRRLV